MLGRYFLIALGLLAVVWSGFLSFQLIDSKDNLSPLLVFGKEDQRILVISRMDETDMSFVDFDIPQETAKLIEQLELKENFSNLVVSEKLDHFLILGKERWNKQLLREIFKNVKSDLEENSISEFHVEDYLVRTEKNRIYMNKNIQIKEILSENWFVFDKKASATLIDLQTKITRNDIYFKSGGQIQYKAQLKQGVIGAQVNDKELFAHVLPQGLSNYHFIEKSYLLSTDKEFKESPMSSWVDKGIVEFDYQGKHVIVTDFITTQDPVNTLFDFMHQDPLNKQYGYFKNLRLKSDFPVSLNKGFYAYDMDDYVVMSSDQKVCEEVVAAYKLGNTLILKEDALASIYDNLPARVSERIVNPEIRSTSTIYHGYHFQTLRTNGKQQQTTGEKKTESYFSYKTGGEVHDFAVLNGKGNLFAATTNGNLVYFQNGKRIWERYLGSKPVGQIEIAEINGQKVCVVSTRSSIHVIDKEGKAVNGFPFVAADKQIKSGPSTFTWKNKLNILYINANNELIRLDQSGNKISSFNSGLEGISQLPQAWVSQRKLFIGVWNDSKFKMTDAERNREYRSFAIPSGAMMIKGTNEVFFSSMRDDELLIVDQKGNQKTLVKNLGGYKLEKVISRNGSTDIFISNGKMYKVIGMNGTVLSEVEIDGKNIGFLDGFVGRSGNSCVIAFDDLENNVYLYALNGEKISDGKYQGMKKAIVSDLILTSIVDDFIVQYEL